MDGLCNFLLVLCITEQTSVCHVAVNGGQKINANLSLYKVFRQPFGSWTSGPKIVDVRT